MALTLTVTRDPKLVKPGQGVTFFIASAVDFVPTDATSPITLSIYAPNGAIIPVTVQHDSLGQYHGDVPIPSNYPPGSYFARAQDQGSQPSNDIAVGEHAFFVEPLDT